MREALSRIVGRSIWIASHSSVSRRTRRRTNTESWKADGTIAVPDPIPGAQRFPGPFRL